MNFGGSMKAMLVLVSLFISQVSFASQNKLAPEGCTMTTSYRDVEQDALSTHFIIENMHIVDTSICRESAKILLKSLLRKLGDTDVSQFSVYYALRFGSTLDAGVLRASDIGLGSISSR
jgi:hypothetical protein